MFTGCVQAFTPKYLFQKYFVLFVLVMPGYSLHSFCQANDENYRVYPAMPAYYTLPITKNGLTESAFYITPQINIRRWEKHADVIVNIDCKQSSPSDPSPSFTHKYNFMGKQYGEQHVGFEPFVPIEAELIKYEVRVVDGAYSKTMIVDGKTNLFGPFPKNTKASQVFVSVKIVAAGFKGTRIIESDILNLKKREKELADKAAAEKLDAIKKENEKKIAVEKEKQEIIANKKEQMPADDFWETGQKKSGAAAPTKTADASRLPGLFKTSDGKYYQKDAADKVKEIDYDEYMRIKMEQSKISKQPATQTKEKQEADQKAVDELMTKIKNDQESSNQVYKEIDRRADLQRQGFAAVGAREEARNNVKELSTLSGSYQSVNQLMADFNQKMSQLNRAVSDLTIKKNQALNSSADAYFNTPDVAAYGAGIKAIGAMVNGAKEAKERRQAQEELRAQKAYMLNSMLAEERRLLTGIRTDLFSRFNEAGLPLSSDKLEANTIWYFVYAYDPMQLGAKQSVLYVSNVFPVSRYSDGSWPFKNSISNEIASLTPYAEILHGYYSTAEHASGMHQGLMDVFAKSGGSVHKINYRDKKAAGATSGKNGDFWETGKKTKAPAPAAGDKKPIKKDDFWNN